MMKFLFAGAFALGLVVIIWIGRIFLGADNLGLGVTILIAAVYAIGTLELLSFRRATATLNRALESLVEPINDLQQWLSTLDPVLRNSVRLRVEGQRNGLPAPVLTPYLVGLLVMLGLLGTFVGMVDTLKGAVVALEGSSELEAIRAGLAAPIEGLGLAFGTSVAGVAASAMLGLLSTLSRRERTQAGNFLDSKVGTELRQFSITHQQQLAFHAMQDQAQALPDIMNQLSSLINGLDRMGEGLGQRLLDNQVQFQDTVTQLYGDLNASIHDSLKTGLVESGQLISSTIQPMTQTTLNQLHNLTKETQERLNSVSEQQLNVINETLHGNIKLIQTSVDSALKQQSNSSAQITDGIQSSMTNTSTELQSSVKLMLDGFTETKDQWVEQQREQATQFSLAIREELAGLRSEEKQRGDAATKRLQELYESVGIHLASLGKGLEEPMMQLIEAASQTPKAAADVIEKLRGEMTKNLERDNGLLAERKKLMEQLDSLSVTLSDASHEQRKSIDSLIERSAQTLSQVGSQFGEKLEGESSKFAGIIDHFSSSSAEMASLGDSFNAGVMLFSESNDQLIENLNRIEAALEQSNSRSDEQLAYYVAQAREIIDHNLLSHQQIIAALHAQKPTQMVVDKVAS